MLLLQEVLLANRKQAMFQQPENLPIANDKSANKDAGLTWGHTQCLRYLVKRKRKKGPVQKDCANNHYGCIN